MSSGCCLQKISILLESEVMPPVVEFVSQNIRSESWKDRYAALIALGAITEGPERAKFSEIIVPSFNDLINMFGDQSVKVREAISWVISKTCEHHAEVMTSSAEQTSILVNALLTALKDRPKISNHCCLSIEKLSESLAPMN